MIIELLSAKLREQKFRLLEPHKWGQSMKNLMIQITDELQLLEQNTNNSSKNIHLNGTRTWDIPKLHSTLNETWGGFLQNSKS